MVSCGLRQTLSKCRFMNLARIRWPHTGHSTERGGGEGGRERRRVDSSQKRQGLPLSEEGETSAMLELLWVWFIVGVPMVTVVMSEGV